MTLVLLLTNSRDGSHTDQVVKHIVDRGGKIIRLNSDELSNGLQTIQWESSGEISLNTPESVHSINDATSVWYRRPKVYDFDIKSPAQEEYAARELDALIDNICALLEHKRWLNTPWAMHSAKPKLRQLILAEKLGMRIARSLVTANPAVARFFCGQTPSIFKPMVAANIDLGGDTFLVPTTFIDKHLMDGLELIRKQHALFQHHVEKVFELRITIVDRTVFAAKQTPHHTKNDSFADWRLLQIGGLSTYERYVVEENLQSKIFAMMKILDLKFATFDFVVDANGEHIFYERR